jgi:hypothetical protein
MLLVSLFGLLPIVATIFRPPSPLKKKSSQHAVAVRKIPRWGNSVLGASSISEMCLVCVRCAPICDQADGLFDLPWTQAWGCFYLVSFIVIKMMNILAEFAAEELDSARNDLLEHWTALCNKVCGIVALLLQLAVLA